MHMAISVKQNVVRLYVSMHDALAVNITQSAAEFGKPELHSILCKRFSGYMKPKIATIHEIDYNVKIFHILEAISEIAEKRVI